MRIGVDHGAPHPKVIRMLRLIVIIAILTFSIGSTRADSICMNRGATVQITQLSYLEIDAEMTVGAHPASPQRQAIMRELARKYCLSAPHPADDSPATSIARTNCSLHTGMYNSQRVYWAECPTCEQAGGCE